MKTIKIFLSIAGFALTSLCFGQLFSENNSEELYYTAYYNVSKNSFEHHLNQYPTRISGGDYFDAPAIRRIYSVPIEYDIRVEDWMTKPFESTYYEADMPVESWMEAPFESSYFEEGPEVESWMTRPFAISEQLDERIDGEIEVESWMLTPWI